MNDESLDEYDDRYACPECDDMCIDNIILSDNGQAVTCGNCGIELPIDIQRYSSYHATSASAPRIKLGPLFSYDRKAHLMERLSMDRCQEPLIPERHQETIRDAFHNYQRLLENKTKDYYTKTDVQKVLRSLDKQDSTRKFTKKYLEKWKSVLSFCCPEQEQRSLSDDEMIKAGTLFQKCSAIWEIWQNKRDLTRKTWRYPKRKHFPNFNFVFRSCFIVRGIRAEHEDWPIPATSDCLFNLVIYVADMMWYHGIVFVTIPNLIEVHKGTRHFIWDNEEIKAALRGSTPMSEQQRHLYKEHIIKLESALNNKNIPLDNSFKDAFYF